MLDTLSHDLHYVLRVLRKRPGFTIAAVLSLALGIGATTVMFSVIDAVDFKPLPFRDADRLVELHEVSGPKGHRCVGCLTATSLETIADWQAQSHSFEAIGFHMDWPYRWQHGDDREDLNGRIVSPNLFTILGVPPLRGRVITAADTQPGARPVVVISYDFWRNRFGADAQIVGTELPIVDYPSERVRGYIVVGVMPRGFGLHSEQLWGPPEIGVRPLYPKGRDNRGALAVARLKSTTTVATARAEIATIARRMSTDYPETHRGWSATAITMRAARTTDGIGGGRYLLFAIVSCVLLIAVINVSNLVLIRGAERQQELAIRSAMGATRSRIVGQLVLECIAVSAAGGTLGVLFAIGGVRVAATRFALAESAIVSGVDGRVLVFAVFLSLVTGLVVGLVPALSLSRGDLQQALRDRVSSGGAKLSRLGLGTDALIAAEMALGLLMLTGAGILGKEFLRLRYEEPGYDPRRMYFVAPGAPELTSADAAQKRSFGRRALETFASMPQVSATAIGSTLSGQWSITPEGWPEPMTRVERPLEMSIDPGFIRLFRLPLITGRPFSDMDRAGAPLVAIVNQAAASRFWDGRPAIGRHILLRDGGSGARQLTVVGVVANTKIINANITGPPMPTVYYPFDQEPNRSARVFMRLTDESPGTLAAVRARLFDLTNRPDNRDLIWPASLEKHMGLTLSPARFNAVALTGFAVFGLLLAAMGVYATVAAVVARRTRELGIRIALGAQRTHVLQLVLRRVAIVAGVGIVAGLAGAAGLTRVIRSMLYGGSATDPRVFIGAVLLLAFVTLFAGYVPARRATRLDPVEALRADN